MPGAARSPGGGGVGSVSTWLPAPPDGPVAMCSPSAGRRLLPLPPLLPSPSLLPLLLLFLVVAPSVSPTAVAASSAQQNHRMRSDWSLHDAEYVLAYINVTYGDPASGAVYQQGGEIGKFSTGLVASARGRLVHVTSRNGTAHHGCDQRWENAPAPGPHQQPWVALIRRGLCNFDVKVENAYHNNASAVIIYDYKEGELHQIQLAKRHHDTIVTVFIPKTQGEDLAHITDSGVEVAMQITPGKRFRYADTNLNKRRGPMRSYWLFLFSQLCPPSKSATACAILTSVLFVSVSFILLMVISLAWLLFYYVQRFRYMHARDQLTKRLVCAAKKAVCRIPVRALKAGDPQLADGECCAVCLEPYRVSDQLRSLPCSHEYHKQCIDPWLLKNRTCPMCKMDILKYFGLSSVSEESIVHLELEAVAVAQGGGAPLSPVLYVTSQPSAASVAAAARAARSRSVSRASLQSMSLVIPSPACVESLYSRGVTGGAVRSRRVSAAPSIGRRREPPRRASAPVPPASEDAGRDALARSLSTPVGPAVSLDPAAGETVVISPAAEVVAPASLVLNAVQTAMHRRCQRSARADADAARPETSQHGSGDSCDGDTPTPEPPTEPEESAEPVPSETPERQPPTEATPADCDSGAASGEMQKHSDAVIQMEDVDADASE